MKKDARKFAELLKNNWMFHDNKDYLAIKDNSKILLNMLGYNAENYEEASSIIMNFFILADKAQQYQFTNKNKEKKIYSVIIKKADGLDEILQRKKNSKYEIYWWKTIRHKKYFLSILNLFIDQFHKLGIMNLYHVLVCTFFLIKAGKAHDRKEWKSVDMYLEKYFVIIEKIKIEKFIEF